MPPWTGALAPSLAGLAGSLLLLAQMSCTPIEDHPASRAATVAPTVPHPLVERDLAEIRASGVIRLVTRYNSSSYFIHKGGNAGFEYELFSRFAKLHHLAIEVVVPDASENLVDVLNSGHGDVLATGTPWDEDLARYVLVTHPYNFAHKVLVLPASDTRPDDLGGLEGLRIHLPLHSPHRRVLQSLKDRYGLRFFVVSAGPLVQDEELIARVASGTIPATVTDENLALAALPHLPGARVSAVLSDKLPITWQVRQNCPELLAALNRNLNRHFRMTSDGPRRDRTYGILYERYYNYDRSGQDMSISQDRPDISGRISPWDELIQAAADSNGFDWRLIVALIYQESRFDPEAVSSAGATGLMQVLPGLAGKQVGRLREPAVNISIGSRILKEIHGGYAYLDSLNRWAFSLATYHAGAGHMADVRRMAIDAGKDPNRWHGSVRTILPRLMEQRYFSRTRHGFYRGAETVAYVQSILNRYQMYRRLVPRQVTAASVLRGVTVAPPPPE